MHGEPRPPGAAVDRCHDNSKPEVYSFLCSPRSPEIGNKYADLVLYSCSLIGFDV